MEDKGVIYFNLGTKCLIRLLVSIHSLRKYWDGPITIISTGTDSNNALKLIDDDINVIEADFPDIKEGKNAVFLKKAAVNRFTPYKLNVFLDSDTIVKGDFTELFDLAEKHDFVVPQFHNWTTSTRAIVKRINGWKDTYPKLMKPALDYGPALNCGVFAFKKDTKFVQEWTDKITPGRNSFIPDETGMQVVIHQYKHLVADQKYNCSCKYSKPHNNDTRIIHFHGRKHCRFDNNNRLIYGADIWVSEFDEVVKSNYLNYKEISKKCNDRMLKRYLRNKKNVSNPLKKEITIVTAVNPPYLDKLKLTLPTWKIKPQFANCPLIVFYNGFENIKDLEWINKHFKNVRYVPWDMDKYDSPRELMLSAFVFGAAAYVETDYWVKIDSDTFFTDNRDVFLDRHFNYDVAGHKWRYTKPGKWITELDDWADAEDLDGDDYLAEDIRPEAIKSKRYGHKRIASWICMHKTEFTIEIAGHAKERLPVPSHDTYNWYMATRLPDRQWCWHNYKSMGAGTHTNIKVIRDRVKNESTKFLEA
jgi:hypothetical protein